MGSSSSSVIRLQLFVLVQRRQRSRRSGYLSPILYRTVCRALRPCLHDRIGDHWFRVGASAQKKTRFVSSIIFCCTVDVESTSLNRQHVFVVCFEGVLLIGLSQGRIQKSFEVLDCGVSIEFGCIFMHF